MRILVTGATGFLGGVLARRLLALGHDVTAQGRAPDKLAKLEAAGAKLLSLDLATAATLPETQADAVIHCAALSSPWGRERDFFAANVTGTRTALKLATAAGVRRFVYISTPTVYFRFRDQPRVPENRQLPKPVNAYARTKRAAEALALGAQHLDPIVLRPRGLYGASDTSLLPRLLRAASKGPLPLINEGRAATDLTHIDDAADAIIAALSATQPFRQRIFNISGGEPLAVRDIAERAAARANIPIRWRKASAALVLAQARAGEAICRLLPGHPEPPITAYSAGLFAFTQTLDITAAREQLGWMPKVSFAEGLDRTFQATGKAAA